MTVPTSGPIAVLPGHSPVISMLGQPLEVKLTGAQTANVYAVTEAEVAPGWAGPPPHIHHREDEAVYVIEGTLVFRIGREEVAAPAGTFVHIPRGIPHTFRSDTDQVSRQLTIYTPAGFEGIFAEVDAAGPARLAEADAEYGLEVLPRDG